MAEWEIEQYDSGKCDVRRSGRSFLYDATDLEEAIQAIKSADPKAPEFDLIEADGYRQSAPIR